MSVVQANRSLTSQIGRVVLHGFQDSQARELLRRAFKELYRGLDLLRNYRLLNYAAFVKILKKCVMGHRWRIVSQLSQIAFHHSMFRVQA